MPRKTCSSCKENKDLTEYNKNKTKRDGLQTLCKDCSKARFKHYWQLNKEKQAKYVQERNKRIRLEGLQYCYNYAQEKGCADCGEKDPACLDFDHVRGEKKHNISKMHLSGYSLKSIQEEIAKCEVRCANCHRKRTSKNQGWYKKIESL